MTRMVSIALSSLLMTQAASVQEPASGTVPDSLSAPGFIQMDLYCPHDLSLGKLPNGADVGSYQIPQEVTRDAGWILIYTRIYTGNVRPNGPRQYRITSERVAYQSFHYFFYAYGYSQSAISYNSDNLWLPEPRSGHIQIERGGQPIASGSWDSDVRLIGYLRRNRDMECPRAN